MRKRSLLFVNFILVISLIVPVVMSGCEMYNNQTASNHMQDDESNKEQESRHNQQEINQSEKISQFTNENQTTASSLDMGGEGVVEESMQFDNAAGEKEGIDDIQKDSDLFIEIYYQDIEGLVIPVTRRIPKQLSVAKSAVNGLIDTPMNRETMSYYGLIPILPNGTEFSINIKEKTAIIDFNNKVLEYNSSKSEQNIISSIVYTLTQFESIDKVKILINGYEQKELKFGTDISSELARENVLINSSEPGKLNLQEGMQKWDIYLLKYIREAKVSQNSGNDEQNENNEVFLIPVSVEFKNTGVDRERVVELIIEYLSTYESNNSGKRLFSALDESIAVNKSKIEGDLLTLDLSINLASYGGSYNEYFFVRQILYSMKQFLELKRLNILVDGEAISFPEGTDFSRPIEFPNTINNIFTEEGYY